MTDRFVEVGLFGTQPDAMRAVALLQTNGIPATLEGPAGANWMGAPPVLPAWRLFVAARDVQRASALLGEAEPTEPTDRGRSVEIEAAEGAAARPSEGPTAIPASAPLPEEYVLVAWARRTRLVAWIGVVFFWCLFGAIFRLVSPPDGIETSREARRLVFQARLVVYATLALYVLVAWMVLRP